MLEKLTPCIRGCRTLLLSSIGSLNSRQASKLSVNHNFICKHETVCSHPRLLITSDVQINITRNYAKDKNKKKESKKGGGKIDEVELSQTFDLEKLYADFRKPIDAMKVDYIEQLTLRTAAGALDMLKVSYEGMEYLLQDLAEIGKKNPKTYALDVSAFPGAIPAITAAINSSGLGLNPQQDGTKIYLQIPKVTKEHRETLAKNAKMLFNKYKLHVNGLKDKKIKWVQDNVPNEDEAFRLINYLTIIGDKHVAEMEQIMKTKQNDLLKTDS